MLRILWITGFALGLISQSAFGGIMLTTTPDSAYIAHGNGFNSVVALAGVNTDGSIVQLGSGVIVSNGSILSAAHFDPSSFASFLFRTGSDVYNPQSTYTSSNYITHPSYVNINSGYDLRLFQLDSAVTDIAPASLFTGTNVLGTVYDMVGYGQSGVIGGNIDFDGQRRGYENVLRNFGSGIRETNNYIGYRFQDIGHPDYRELGGLLWHGDSGGGWFVNGELAGITNSSILIPGIGSRAFASTIDIDWVHSNSVSITAVPEPTSFALLGTAFSILGLVGLRRKGIGKVELNA